MLAAVMGWIGTLGTIGAYVMLSRGYVSPTSIRYGVLNLVGGLLGASGSAAYGAWPSVASNLVWAVVAYAFDVAFDVKYGYLRDKPGSGYLLDLLGPWPVYVVVALGVLLAGWALMTWPWERARRRARQRPQRV